MSEQLEKTIKYNIRVNGLLVDAEYKTDDVKNVFMPLLNRLTEIQKEKGRRIIAFLAAPPGLGKTTLTYFLEKLSNETRDTTEIQAAGMDGFHHYAGYLKTHKTVRDNKEILLDEIKGAPDTFDVERLACFIEKLKSEKEVLWPTYDRTKHDVVDDGYVLNRDIILLEGNYLLLSEERWQKLRKYADFTIFAYADIDILKPRLIERKVMSGHDKSEAERFYEFSDGRNAELVLKDRPEADLIMEYKDGHWIIQE